MSKGTKQIRMGKVQRFTHALSIQLMNKQYLIECMKKEGHDESNYYHVLLGEVHQLEKTIQFTNEWFGIEG